MKHYNPLKRECTTCETLMNKEYYKKFHTQDECNENIMWSYERKKRGGLRIDEVEPEAKQDRHKMLKVAQPK